MKKKTNRKPKKRSTKTHIKRSRQVQELSFTYGWMVVQWTMHIWYPLFDNEEEPSRNEVPMPKPLPEQKAWNPQPVHSGTSTQTSIDKYVATMHLLRKRNPMIKTNFENKNQFRTKMSETVKPKSLKLDFPSHFFLKFGPCGPIVMEDAVHEDGRKHKSDQTLAWSFQSSFMMSSSHKKEQTYKTLNSKFVWWMFEVWR